MSAAEPMALSPERARVSALLAEGHDPTLPLDRRLAALLECVTKLVSFWDYEHLDEFCALGVEILALLRPLVPEGRDRARSGDDGIECAAEWADELRTGNFDYPYECNMEPALFELQCGLEALTPATISRADVDLAVRALEGFGTADQCRRLAGAALPLSRGGVC